VLGRRIDDRVAAMRTRGLVEEVRGLDASGPLSRTARQAIGYKEVLAAPVGTDSALEPAWGEIVRRTRALARRQRMWFRRDPRITWLASADNPCTVLPALLALWGR
jgi:tRNA dimethylallyltransferase